MSSQASTLLTKLESELKEQQLSDSERTKVLEQLKILGRNPSEATPIFEKQNLKVLCRYAFDNGINSASREAMRCLANAMFLNVASRQTFIDLEYSGKATERLKNDDRDDEFLASRIIFFATYTGKLDIPTLVDRHGLSDSIIKNLQRAVSRLDAPSADSSPITSMAHQETLKLISNIVHFSPDSATSLHEALTPLVALTLRTPLPEPALQPPITLLVNALLVLNPPAAKVEDASLREPLYPSSDPSSLATRLTNILDLAFPSALNDDSDVQLSPLLSLLRVLYSSGPDTVQSSLRATLLPSVSSRTAVLGKDSSLSARIIRASNSPSGSTARDVCGALLFELSGSRGDTLVQNIGYGYAIGILARFGIATDAETLGAGTAVDGVEGDVNPITGQRRDMELQPDKEMEMTDEEKEREAERLFVLFERLKATGVVDVKNPVELAREQGLFDKKD